MKNQDLNQLPALESTPTIESSVFDDNPQATYWIGKVAVPSFTIKTKEFLAQRQLRANVYIDELNYLPPEARRFDNGESDFQDDSATQYVVLENGSPKKAVGSLRMIQKKRGLLPAEKLFANELNEEFPPQSLEASRFIARHHEKTAQALIALGLVRSAILQAVAEQTNFFAVVEEPLARRFTHIGLEYDVLCESKILPEYNNTDNMLLRFDPTAIMKTVANDIDNQRIITPYLQNALLSEGTGYYNQLMHTMDHKGD